ncbi:hypothetical protein AVEN_215112-1 [Araneus ventricosus]|uniref:Reverse transcriptase domain-containing protein n=1 Tax=Araneus ventricosus TaxID=182803 RepID=A0A4Y2JCL9_ARAVE|nr:hypothetical protein AVEN_215112-1 [Araneus ventricosus]
MGDLLERVLTAARQPDRYPISHLHDFTHNSHVCIVFLTLDLERAYHYQMPVEPSDIEKTTICRPSRLYEITRITFGLHNADQIFQRFLHSVFRGLDFSFSFLDDILIESKDEAQHISHLRQVSQHLQDAGLEMNVNSLKPNKIS